MKKYKVYNFGWLIEKIKEKYDLSLDHSKEQHDIKLAYNSIDLYQSFSIYIDGEEFKLTTN